MNLIKMVTTAMCLALAFASLPATAQSEPEPFYTDLVLPLLPWRGVYYDAGQGGTGLTLEVDGNNFVFAVFYTYDPAGNQTYYMIQGEYVPTSEETRHDTGVIGRMDNPSMYTSANGECVGVGCTYHAPDNTVVNIHASFVWTTPQRVHITMDGQSWDMQGGQLTVTNTALIEGQWSWVRVFDNHSTPAAGDRITRQGLITTTNCDWTAAYFTMPVEGDADYEEDQLALPDDARICQLVVEGAAGTPLTGDADSGVTLFLWHAPLSGETGIFWAKERFGKWEQIREVTSLYVVGPNTLRGRTESAVRVSGETILSRIYPGATPYVPE